MKYTIGQALGISVLGLCIVFAVLAVLMCVIMVMEVVFRKKNAPAPQTAPAVPADVPAAPLANGSCGEIKRFDVPDKTAAMLMAIVADELDAPLNELRFISIREVEDDAK